MNSEPEKISHHAKPNMHEKSSSTLSNPSAVQVIENKNRKMARKSAVSTEMAPKHVKSADCTEMARKIKNNDTSKAGNEMSEKEMIERIHRMRLDGNAAFPDIVACTR